MANYFNYFPKEYYFLNDNTSSVDVVTNITSKFKFEDDFKNNTVVYYEYEIQDGETPEIIAEKVYGSSLYHWIVMLSNDSYDYLTDFPLEEYRLVRVIQDKYGEDVYSVHHYEIGRAHV